jgi:hypothetical protein
MHDSEQLKKAVSDIESVTAEILKLRDAMRSQLIAREEFERYGSALGDVANTLAKCPDLLAQVVAGAEHAAAGIRSVDALTASFSRAETIAQDGLDLSRALEAQLARVEAQLQNVDVSSVVATLESIKGEILHVLDENKRGVIRLEAAIVRYFKKATDDDVALRDELSRMQARLEKIDAQTFISVGGVVGRVLKRK